MPFRPSPRPSPSPPTLGPASVAAGGNIGTRLPEPQLLRVVWPDGRSETRLVRLDPVGGCIRLRDVPSSGAKVGGQDGKQGGRLKKLGAETSVELAALGGVDICNGALKLQGPSGETLLELHLETTEQMQSWLGGIQFLLDDFQERESSRKKGFTSDTGPSKASGAEAAALRALCQQQEERAQALEALNMKKEQQLLKLHGRLEEALLVLQAGQKMYSEQQGVLEEQQATIEELCKISGIAGLASEAGRSASASAPVSSAIADGGLRGVASVQTGDPSKCGAANDGMDDSGSDTGTEDGGPEADEDAETEAEADEGLGEMEALARRAEDLQRQLQELGQAAGGSDAPAALQVQASGAGRVATSRAVEDAPQLLAHLQALIAEKDRLEAQLRNEQQQLEQQLSELYSQMDGPESDEAEEPH